jgi:hypothetical protein
LALVAVLASNALGDDANFAVLDVPPKAGVGRAVLLVLDGSDELEGERAVGCLDGDWIARAAGQGEGQDRGAPPPGKKAFAPSSDAPQKVEGSDTTGLIQRHLALGGLGYAGHLSLESTAAPLRVVPVGVAWSLRSGERREKHENDGGDSDAHDLCLDRDPLAIRAVASVML